MEGKITNALRAEILVNALPYIKSYTNKIIVVKYGGNAMINDELREAVMSDIVLLSTIGVKVVLVHGGGPEITDLLDRMGKKTEFVDGLRVTDAETAEAAQMVLAGKINKNLVNMLQIKGGHAIGVCGLDGHLIEAKKIDERLGFVGEITKIDPEIIYGILENNYIPVVSTVGCDNEGNVYNIKADTAAADQLNTSGRAYHSHIHQVHIILCSGITHGTEETPHICITAEDGRLRKIRGDDGLCQRSRRLTVRSSGHMRREKPGRTFSVLRSLLGKICAYLHQCCFKGLIILSCIFDLRCAGLSVGQNNNSIICRSIPVYGHHVVGLIHNAPEHILQQFLIDIHIRGDKAEHCPHIRMDHS